MLLAGLCVCVCVVSERFEVDAAEVLEHVQRGILPLASAVHAIVSCTVTDVNALKFAIARLSDVNYAGPVRERERRWWWWANCALSSCVCVARVCPCVHMRACVCVYPRVVIFLFTERMLGAVGLPLHLPRCCGAVPSLW